MKQASEIRVIEEEESGQRLDNYLFKVTQRQLPRSRIHRMIRSGEAKVNQKRCLPSLKLSAGDTVRIPPFFSEKDSTRTCRPILSQLSNDIILYEDSDLIAINKPRGLACHGGSGIHFGLIEQIRQNRPHEKFLELVHRLDRDTSGIILIAKKRKALVALHELFRNHNINKRYIAIVEGRWRDLKRTIKQSLGTHQINNEKRAFVDQIHGKTSITETFLIARNTELSIIEARPLTGRTHQIRIHLASSGHPILGDDKYNKNKKHKKLCLHSAYLQFSHPSSQKDMIIQAPLPIDMGEHIKTTKEFETINVDKNAIFSLEKLVDQFKSMTK